MIIIYSLILAVVALIALITLAVVIESIFNRIKKLLGERICNEIRYYSPEMLLICLFFGLILFFLSHYK